MFLSYSTTEKPKNGMFDVTFLPVLPITEYSHIHDLLILFNEIFIYLIQYIL